MVSDALRRLIHEQKLRHDAGLAERESQRLAEVRAAFFEGMEAGNDQLWHERPREDYWLESDARRTLYAGPAKPTDPSKRAALMMKATHGGRQHYNYDPLRDPGRVLAGGGNKQKRRKRGPRR